MYFVLPILAVLVSPDLLNLRSVLGLASVPLPVPWPGRTLKTLSWGNQGLTAFFSCLFGIAVLNYLISRVLIRTIVSIILSIFWIGKEVCIVSCRRLNLVSLNPF